MTRVKLTFLIFKILEFIFISTHNKSYLPYPSFLPYRDIIALQIHGEKSSYQAQCKFYRYHMVIAKVPQELLSMQEMGGCDYFRTPVKFQVPDIFMLSELSRHVL